MADAINTTNDDRAKRIAVDRIVGFAKQFGEEHLNLACHAAFPLALTPDLLYQIWANFVPRSPWTAVARVLLSRLCREVGYEMYEMDIAVRNLLLKELKEQFGQKRFEELAEFLIDYVAQRLNDDDPDTQDLAQAQKWTALAYTKPELAARELEEALKLMEKQKDMAEVYRLASLVETFAEPLKEAGFEPLLVYSRSMETLARGDNSQKAANKIVKLPRKEPEVKVTPVAAGKVAAFRHIKRAEIKYSHRSMDERLHELMRDVLQNGDGSPLQRQAIEMLVKLIPKLPGIYRHQDPRIEYSDALNRALEGISVYRGKVSGQNIRRFIEKLNMDIDTEDSQVLRQNFLRWFNKIMRNNIVKIYNETADNLSLDVQKRADDATTLADMLPDPKLSGLESLVSMEEKADIERLRRYIEEDPEMKLRNIYVRGYPQSSCRELALRRILKDTPDKWKDIAQDLDVPYGTVTSFWRKKCKPILMEIARDLIYRHEKDS